jgi:stage II sporulation protein R
MNRKVITALIIVLTGLSACAGWFCYLSNHNSINSGYIRLHILANSNNPLDQALKYMVRDEVVRLMTEHLSDVKSIEQARNIVAVRQGDIKEAACRVIAREGYAYPVAVRMGHYRFPDRTYHAKSGGELTLPAGEYEAVRIIIGQGKGANWWCVLFPPLCFVSPASLAVNTANVSGEGAGAEKYPCSGGNEAPGIGSGAKESDSGHQPAASIECCVPADWGLSGKTPAQAPEEMQQIKFRFKLVEWFQDSRHWLDKAFR